MLVSYTAGRVVGSDEYVLIMRDTETGELKSIPTNPGGTVVHDGKLYSANGVQLADENTYRDLEFFSGGFQLGVGYGTYLATDVKRDKQLFVSAGGDTFGPSQCEDRMLTTKRESTDFSFDYLDRDFFKGTFLEKFNGRELYLAVDSGRGYSHIVDRGLWLPLVGFWKMPVDGTGQHNEVFYHTIGLPKFSKDRKVLQVKAKGSPFDRREHLYGVDSEFLAEHNSPKYLSGHIPCYRLD